MEKITIYEFDSPDINILIQVYFNEENKLIFDGYDTGKTVIKLMGDSEYEYKYTVGFEEVKKIATIFEIDFNDKRTFLNEIKNRFNENDAYSKFGKFMKENDIKFDSFIWR